MSNINEAIVILSKIGTLLEVGVAKSRALELALTSTADETKLHFSKEFIAERVSQINSGGALSAELDELNVFSEYELTVIAAAEDTGSLEFGITSLIDEYLLFHTLGA